MNEQGKFTGSYVERSTVLEPIKRFFRRKFCQTLPWHWKSRGHFKQSILCRPRPCKDDHRYSDSTERDLQRFRDAIALLASRNVKVMTTNSNCHFVRELYSDFELQGITDAESGIGGEILALAGFPKDEDAQVTGS